MVHQLVISWTLAHLALIVVLSRGVMAPKFDEECDHLDSS
jgi:hypothetical protein